MAIKHTKMPSLMDKLATHYKQGKLVADDHIENRVKIYRKDPEFKRYGFTERGDYLVDLHENKEKKWSVYVIDGEERRFPTLSFSAHGSDYYHHLRSYLELMYGIRYKNLNKFADELDGLFLTERSIDPVRVYLDSLVWDGKPRLETALAEQTGYHAELAKKVFIGAVKRLYEPGEPTYRVPVLWSFDPDDADFWSRNLSPDYLRTVCKRPNNSSLEFARFAWIQVYNIRGLQGDYIHKKNSEFLARLQDEIKTCGCRLVADRIWDPWLLTDNPDRFFTEGKEYGYVTVKVSPEMCKRSYDEYYVHQLWAEAKQLYFDGFDLTKDITYLVDKDEEYFYM